MCWVEVVWFKLIRKGVVLYIQFRIVQRCIRIQHTGPNHKQTKLLVKDGGQPQPASGVVFVYTDCAADQRQLSTSVCMVLTVEACLENKFWSI